MTIKDLNINEYNPYYDNYISKVNKATLNDGLATNYKTIELFLKSIPHDKLEYRYADGKWTIKEIVQHLIDTERVFTYRALRIARKDQTPLPGYDENAFATTSASNARSFDSLLAEYVALRAATIALFTSFTNTMLLEKGIASGSAISVRAIGFILIGHENHHCEIIKERYL